MILSGPGLERYDRGAAVWRVEADAIAGYGTRLLPGPGGTRMLLVGSDGSAAVELSTGAMHRMPAMVGTTLHGMDKAGWFGGSASRPIRDLLVGPEPGRAIALERDATGENRLHALQVYASGELEVAPFAETATAVRLAEGSADSVASMDRAEEFYEVWSLVDRRRVATKQPTRGCVCQAARNELALAEAVAGRGRRISEQQLPPLDLLTMNPAPRGLFVEFFAFRATLLDLETGAAIAHMPTRRTRRGDRGVSPRARPSTSVRISLSRRCRRPAIVGAHEQKKYRLRA